MLDLNDSTSRQIRQGKDAGTATSLESGEIRSDGESGEVRHTSSEPTREPASDPAVSLESGELRDTASDITRSVESGEVIDTASDTVNMNQVCCQLHSVYRFSESMNTLVRSKSKLRKDTDCISCPAV